MIKKAVFPGSFAPFTKGHESVMLRALPLFDEIVIAVGVNSEKNEYFSLEERCSCQESTASLDFQGLNLYLIHSQLHF